MLALGRHFPLYRLFYSLPYCSRIRCPIKFLHLSGTAFSFLFAFGMASFFQRLRKVSGRDNSGDDTPPIPSIRRAWIASGSVAVALMLVFAIASSSVAGNKQDLIAHWTELGFGAFSEPRLALMSGALKRAALTFGLAGVVFLGAVWLGKRPWFSGALAVCLLVVVPLDLVNVGRRYVHVQDVDSRYRANPVAQAMRASAGGERDMPLGRLSYHLSPTSGRSWLYSHFVCNGVKMLQPVQEFRFDDRYKAFFRTLQSDIVRLWQLTNCEYAVGPVKMFQGLVSSPAFDVMMYFDVQGGRIVPTGQRPSSHVLLRFKHALPRAAVFHRWRSLGDEDVLRALADKKRNVAAELLTASGGERTDSTQITSPVEFLEYGRQKVALRVSLPEEGILVLNDKYDSAWTVRVDGEKSELLRCNYIMRGVRVPAGEHSVVFSYRPYLAHFVLAVVAFLSLVLWVGGTVFLVFRRSRTGGERGN